MSNVQRKYSYLAFFFTLLVSGTLEAVELPKTYQQCVACHGDNGRGNAQLKAPVLAGQSASYLTRQLHNFANGLRGADKRDALGQQMVAVSQQLDFSNQVPALAQALSQQSVKSEQAASSGDLKNGSRYYQAKCGACHGGQAQGNEAFNAPKLAGQLPEYLKRQMNNFVSDIRGSHTKDKLGRQMAMMAKTTSGKELDDILHYIAVQQ
ncbi:cytochrome c [Thalassotalea insulae]|uniref:Cytochrome c n=1 Tax=Thalassotalea insulae TaxID=2056778 RepID=A0ABQ6GY39_9GAMM|nr:c-type cytochrome [Thalassotalea insulae]GLX79517.1 cytochrome c [Thalassotalea insulae]